MIISRYCGKKDVNTETREATERNFARRIGQVTDNLHHIGLKLGKRCNQQSSRMNLMIIYLFYLFVIRPTSIQADYLFI